MKNFFKQLPVQLVVSILFAFFLGSVLDLTTISFFYTVSTCIIKLLIFILPILVFSFIFRALIVSSTSLTLLLLIFAGTTISNIVAVLVAFFFGKTFLSSFGMTFSQDFAEKLASQVPLLFQFNLPSLLGAEKALALGIVLGACFSFLKDGTKVKKIAQEVSLKLNLAIGFFLKRIFIPLLPLYVFGFCLKLSYERSLLYLFQEFGKVFIFGMFILLCYLFLLYFLGSGLNVKRTIFNIKTMLPAGLTGFSTMSSAATMPVTLNCTEEATQDKNFSQLIIPATCNIHMLGDDIMIVMSALTLLSAFGMEIAPFMEMIPFAFAFSLAKLSCVGVPGASVLVILPVLQSYLGFSSEMMTIITTIYILQDSFVTASNVMGNGAFALIIQRLYSRLKALRFAT